jgi:hypothetical protein
MRLKLDELKGRIAGGNEQRRALRRQLSELQRRRDDPQRDPPGTAAAVLPPQAIAARALELTAKLAEGDPDAWRTAKKMRVHRDLITGRVGIHHRIVFRIEGRSLQVLDVVHRKDLESALERADS